MDVDEPMTAAPPRGGEDKPFAADHCATAFEDGFHDHRRDAARRAPPQWVDRAPTPQELLELSHRVYKHSRRLYSEADAQGLRVYHDERLDGSDVRIVMLVPSWFPRPHVSFDSVLPRLRGDTVSVAIVVRGTVRDLVGNTIANLQLLFNKLVDDQYVPDAAADATKVVQGWLLELLARHPELRPPGGGGGGGGAFGGPEWPEPEGGFGGRRLRLNVSITGHSLGGLIAEAATVESSRFADAHAIRWRCVSFESPGLPDVYYNAGLRQRPAPGAWDETIVAYLAAPNPINMLGSHLGTVIHVLVQWEQTWSHVAKCVGADALRVAGWVAVASLAGGALSSLTGGRRRGDDDDGGGGNGDSGSVLPALPISVGNGAAAAAAAAPPPPPTASLMIASAAEGAAARAGRALVSVPAAAAGALARQQCLATAPGGGSAAVVVAGGAAGAILGGAEAGGGGAAGALGSAAAAAAAAALQGAASAAAAGRGAAVTSAVAAAASGAAQHALRQAGIGAPLGALAAWLLAGGGPLGLAKCLAGVLGVEVDELIAQHGLGAMRPCFDSNTGELHVRFARRMRAWPHLGRRGEVVLKAVQQAARWTLPSFLCRDNLGVWTMLSRTAMVEARCSRLEGYEPEAAAGDVAFSGQVYELGPECLEEAAAGAGAGAAGEEAVAAPGSSVLVVGGGAAAVVGPALEQQQQQQVLAMDAAAPVPPPPAAAAGAAAAARAAAAAAAAARAVEERGAAADAVADAERAAAAALAAADSLPVRARADAIDEAERRRAALAAVSAALAGRRAADPAFAAELEAAAAGAGGGAGAASRASTSSGSGGGEAVVAHAARRQRLRGPSDGGGGAELQAGWALPAAAAGEGEARELEFAL